MKKNKLYKLLGLLSVIFLYSNPLFSQCPDIANAGADQDVCVSSGFLTGNLPAGTNTGLWTTSGGGTIGQPNLSSTLVTNLLPGTNTFTWSIYDGGTLCASDDVVITNNEVFAYAGTDQTICTDYATLSASTPISGAGRWFISEGTGYFTDSLSTTTMVTGLTQGPNNLGWIVDNGFCSNTAYVLITNNGVEAYTVSDTIICTSSFELNANTPLQGTGAWTINYGSAFISDHASGFTSVSSLGQGATSIRWTVTNGACVAHDDIVITNNEITVTADAGFDYTICTDFYTLTASNPAPYTGAWMVNSGSGIVANVNNPTSEVSSLSVGFNELTWSIVNGGCESVDNLYLTNNSVTADAGIDSTVCNGFAYLHGSIPTQGIGYWSVMSGSGTLTNSCLYNTTVSSLGVGANTFRWNINNAGCIGSDDVIITNENLSIFAGGEEPNCTDTTTLLADPLPIGATGKWSVSSGTGNFANSMLYNTKVTGMTLGTENIFTWTVTKGACVMTDDFHSFNYGYTANAGSDIHSCTVTSVLKAPALPAGQTGYWSTVSGTVNVNNSTSNTSVISGLTANSPAVLRWNVYNGSSCNASDDVTITYDVPSNATISTGSQVLCTDSIAISATAPTVGTGTWELANITGTFASNVANSTMLRGISNGVGALIWTVNQNGCTNSSQIALTNYGIKTINAGVDINHTSPSGTINNIINLAAATPGFGTGTWSVVEGSAVIANPNLANSQITLSRGRNVLKWTVNHDVCSNTDEIVIINSYQILSQPTLSTVSWSDPTNWVGGEAPGEFDDVVIQAGQCTIGSANAKCKSITVASGSNVNVSGSGKVVARLETQSIIIEQTAEKGGKGNSSMTISGSANVVIKMNESDVTTSKVAAKFGVVVGAGGSLIIEQMAEKGAKVNSATMTLNPGATMIIEQTAEKGGSKLPAGIVNIKSGGSLIFNSNTTPVTTADLIIRQGGILSVEDNSKPGVPAGTLEMAAGRTISISDIGSKLSIIGGKVTVVAGNTKSKVVAETLSLTKGATLIIEQTAEKTTVLSEAHFPTVNVDGGSILIGDPGTQTLVNAKLYTRSLTIQPKAATGISTDISLMMYSNAGLYVEPGTSPTDATFTINKGNTVSMLDGSEVILTDGTKTGTFILDKEASLLNMSSKNTFSLQTAHDMTAGKTEYLSIPFYKSTASMFGFLTLQAWSESSNSWSSLFSTDELNPGVSYSIISGTTESKTLSGNVTAGSPVLNLKSTDVASSGWNLLGNPYLSAIDLEKIITPTGVTNSFYIYNPATMNFQVFQKGGLNLNGASSYVMPYQGFFVKAEKDVDFTINNDAQLHYFGSPAPATSSVANFIKFKVSGNNLSDEAAIRFSNTADSESDAMDAYKKFADSNEVPQLFTSTQAGLNLAINALPDVLEPTSIPLNFRAGKSGSYKISLSEVDFSKAEVELKDLKTGTVMNLSSFSDYSFAYESGSDYNFEVRIGAFNSVNEINNLTGVTIFAANKNVVILNSELSNLNVEIFDITGKIVASRVISETGRTEINMNSANGIYLVKAGKDNKVYTQKVIIK